MVPAESDDTGPAATQDSAGPAVVPAGPGARARWVQAAVRSAPRLEMLLDLELTTADGSRTLDSLAELAASIARSSYAAVSVALPQRGVFAGAFGIPSRVTVLPAEDSMCGHVVAGGRRLEVHAGQGDEVSGVLAAAGLATYVGHPVLVGGEVLGSLCVFDDLPLEIDEAQDRQLAAVARHTADLLALQRELHQLRLDRDRRGAESEVLAHLSAGRPLTRLLGVLAQDLVGDEAGLGCAVLVRDGKWLRLTASAGLPPELAERLADVPVSSRAGLVGAAAALRVPMDGTGRGPHVLVEPHPDPRPGEPDHRTGEAAWGRAIPIVEQDVAVGVLAVVVPAGRGVPDRLEARLAATAGLCALALQRSRQAERAGEHAVRDGLTGLLNRPGFLAAAHEALDGVHGPHAVLSLDVDRLKVLNDSLGHQRGDQVLRTVAARLRDTVRRTDVVARLGGDEFVVLCPGLDTAKAQERARALAEHLAGPLQLGGATVSSVVSIGVATADVVVDVQELVRSAERALAVAKSRGRGRVAALDAAASTAAQESSELELDLRTLLLPGGQPQAQLHLEYQPQITLADGGLAGVEALLRWQHPRLGPVAPDRFIPLAEDAGLMPSLGAFVLDAALAQHRRWVEERSPWAGATLWVNISATQLDDPTFPAHVREALDRDGAPPDRLGLEITESAVTAQSPTTRTTLANLRALGVRLAVDDFGTGFSNLALLRSTPVDVLKIDRSLVAGIGEDTRLVDAVLGLAQALDLDVVAEGVETPGQLEVLAGRDCTMVQGYLLGRPRPAELLVLPDPATTSGAGELRTRTVRAGAAVEVVPDRTATGTTGGAASTSPSGPAPDFDSAAREVLAHLRALTGMSLWTVTRAAGPDQIVLVADSASQAYRVAEGAVLPWQSSLCAQMVRGAPTIAPDVETVPQYAAAPNRALLPIGAYIGIPLHDHRGELFGSLCAFDASRQSEQLHRAEPTIRLLAELLSTILAAELRRDELARRAEKAEAEASIDPLTGIANRRGWAEVLAREEARCRRYGHEAAIIVVDLDGLKETNDSLGHRAGDELLRLAASTLRSHVRSGDLVARLGGDEFGVLAVHTGATGAQAELDRLRAALLDVGVSASAGLAGRAPGGSLAQAWQEADTAMYADKQTHRIRLDPAPSGTAGTSRPA